jgi:NTE family protein
LKIGISLSGGGFRAAVFHLGVLSRLAEEKRLEDIAFLSTVSGGSLCTGLIFALNDYTWPSSNDYLENILPKARYIMTTHDLQLNLFWRVLCWPLRLLNTRADDLSRLLKKHWGINIMLSDLPVTPRWMINATCYETGKNWRFERFRMGDYKFGYSYDTDVPLSDAIAASAGFPILIGPLTFKTKPYSWFYYKDKGIGIKELNDPIDHMKRLTAPIKKPAFTKLHLWDGGIYDNLGLEGLHNFIEGWRKDVEFLIVSDASGKGKPARYCRLTAIKHMISGIAMDQIRSLRSRAIIERLVNHPEDKGSFFQIGNTCSYILKNSKKAREINKVCLEYLNEKDVERAESMKTHISKLTGDDFDRLFRHGFEVADLTLYGHNDESFNYIGFSKTRWS